MPQQLYGYKTNRTKPSRGAQINWSHPLAWGLNVYAALNENGRIPFAIPNNTALTLTGTLGTWTSGPTEIGLNSEGVGSLSLVAAQWNQPTAAYTFAMSWRAKTATAFQDVPKAVDYNVTGKSIFFFEFASTTSAYIVGRDGANAQYTTSPTTLPQNTTTAPHIYVATLDTKGDQIARFYQDAIQIGTVSGITGINAGFSSDFILNGNGIGSTFGLGESFWVGYWTRALSAAEVAWLTAEPYAFFQPQGPRAQWFIPTAAPTTLPIFVQC